jgi:uncharacterized damage-inducible protein DinB
MSANEITGSQQMIRMMTHYMAWANTTMFNSVLRIPQAEIVRERQTLFGNIAHTFNHILVVHEIFRAHLEGTPHPYTARNTETAPLFAEVRDRLEKMDQYFIAVAERLTSAQLDEVISFTFVGGGDGSMTRMEILLHLVNHATYHRGFISDMLYQVPHKGDSNDLPVFLRDVWPGIQAGHVAGNGPG